MFDLFRKIDEDISLLDRKAVFALLYTAIGLSCIYYFKDISTVSEILGGTAFQFIPDFILKTTGNNLRVLGYWVLVGLVFYFVIPVFVLKVIYKDRLSEYGLRSNLEPGFWKVFSQCLVVMIPLVYVMSLTAGFSAKYPFLKIYADAPYLSLTFLIWELIYFCQFLGLEFFFRGFLLHSLKPALGLYSIFAMTVPYCMIHFGKPMPETIAAIVAGVFLGWLSYKNGSIWLGLLLHCSVAFLMDALSLYNKGLLFYNF
ncbi:MAG: CPBP family intramembrane glutamic endopeptidase [Pyrinomonadaceae bacterium]